MPIAVPGVKRNNGVKLCTHCYKWSEVICSVLCME